MIGRLLKAITEPSDVVKKSPSKAVAKTPPSKDIANIPSRPRFSSLPQQVASVQAPEKTDLANTPPRPRLSSLPRQVVPVHAPEKTRFQHLLETPEGFKNISEILKAAENETDAILRISLDDLLKLRQPVTGNNVLQLLVIDGNFQFLNKLLNIIEKKSEIENERKSDTEKKSDHLRLALRLKNSKGQTIFHTIAIKAAVRFQEIAIKWGQYPEILEIKEKETGHTAMHRAARNAEDKTSIFLAALLEANPQAGFEKIVNGAGNTPLALKVRKNENRAKAEEEARIKAQQEVPANLNVKQLLKDIDDATALNGRLESKKKAARAKVEELKNQLQQAKNEATLAKEESEKRYNGLKTKFEEFQETSEMALREKEEAVNTAIQKIRIENEDLRGKLAALHTAFPNYGLDNIVKVHETRLAKEKEEEQEQFNKQLLQAEQERDVLSKKVVTLESNLAIKDQELATLRAEKEALLRLKNTLEAQLSAAESNLSAQREEVLPPAPVEPPKKTPTWKSVMNGVFLGIGITVGILGTAALFTGIFAPAAVPLLATSAALIVGASALGAGITVGGIAGLSLVVDVSRDKAEQEQYEKRIAAPAPSANSAPALGIPSRSASPGNPIVDFNPPRSPYAANGQALHTAPAEQHGAERASSQPDVSLERASSTGQPPKLG